MYRSLQTSGDWRGVCGAVSQLSAIWWYSRNAVHWETPRLLGKYISVTVNVEYFCSVVSGLI